MKSADYATLLRTLPALYEGKTLDELPRCFLEFLSSIVPSNAIGYNEVNLKKGRIIATMNPSELSKSKYIEVLGHYIGQHPLVQYQQRTGDTSARKISDFLSRAQYHRLPVYQEVYRHIGGEDQFALTLRMTNETIAALALNRGRRSFTEAHRDLLNLVQPHLVQAYRNAETLTRLRKQLASVRSFVDTLPLGLVALDHRFRITSSTERARKLLEQHFPKASSYRSLPVPLHSWLSRTCKWRGRALPNATHSFSQESPTGKLSVRCIREAGRSETILLLHERSVSHSAESLRSLGLTAREAEVLLWVSRGKSNAEIAIILGAAPRTIQKHLEHVFAKLGVERRIEAAHRALEVFSPDFPLI